MAILSRRSKQKVLKAFVISLDALFLLAAGLIAANLQLEFFAMNASIINIVLAMAITTIALSSLYVSIIKQPKTTRDQAWSLLFSFITGTFITSTFAALAATSVIPTTSLAVAGIIFIAGLAVVQTTSSALHFWLTQPAPTPGGKPQPKPQPPADKPKGKAAPEAKPQPQQSPASPPAVRVSTATDGDGEQVTPVAPDDAPLPELAGSPPRSSYSPPPPPPGAADHASHSSPNRVQAPPISAEAQAMIDKHSPKSIRPQPLALQQTPNGL